MSAAARRVPRTPTEALLSALFEEVLGRPVTSIDDGFFDLGGDSESAVRLVARIRATLGVRLSIRTLFERHTIAGVAQSLSAGAGRDPLDVLLPLRPAGAGPALFCVHAGLGVCWSYVGLLSALGPQRPVYGLQSRGMTQPGRRPPTIQAMARDYLRRVRSVQPFGPYCLFGWSFGGLVVHALAAELERAGERIALVAIIDTDPEETRAWGRGGEGEDLRLLLRSLGRDPNGEGPEPSRAGCAEALASGWSALSSLDHDQRLNLVDNWLHHLRLARAHVPPRFGGDVVLCLAAGEGSDASSAVEAWRPYVGGTIEDHRLDRTHEEMMGAAALARIAQIVAARMGPLP